MNYRKPFIQFSILVLTFLFINACNKAPKQELSGTVKEEIKAEPVPEPQYLYGIQIDSFEVKKGQGQTKSKFIWD